MILDLFNERSTLDYTYCTLSIEKQNETDDLKK